MRGVIVALLLMAAPSAQERPLPDFATFAARVKEHLALDEERQSGYTFIERRIEQKLDGAGPADQRVGEGVRGIPGLAR